MRAAIMRAGEIQVDDFALPEPGPGHVIAKTMACGICGSDLHFLKHGQKLIDTERRAGGSMIMDLSRDVVMGHEFCAEVLDYGPGSERRFKPGNLVVSVPAVSTSDGPEVVGYSNTYPGGFGEQIILNAPNLLAVPNGLSAPLAAMTEPMAVGVHAVAKAQLEPRDVAVVIGCGPVGLAVIASLKAKGHGPVLAADFSARRRRLAEAMGADDIIDPAKVSPYGKWRDLGVPFNRRDLALAISSKANPRRAVLFECVGVPGVLAEMMDGAPAGSRIVVVGVCMESDHVEPAIGVVKELEVQFVLGYSAAEFAASLRHIAEGDFDVAPLITSTVGLDGVARAFKTLADPGHQAKIMIDPTMAPSKARASRPAMY